MDAEQRIAELERQVQNLRYELKYDSPGVLAVGKGYLGEDCPGCGRNRLEHMDDGTVKCEKCAETWTYEQALESLRKRAAKCDEIEQRLSALESRKTIAQVSEPDPGPCYTAESARGQAGEGEAHCKDCCCARSWKALGVESYTGKSIPEHIEENRRQLWAAREDIAAVKRALESAGKLGPVVHIADRIMDLAAERDAAVRENERLRRDLNAACGECGSDEPGAACPMKGYQALRDAAVRLKEAIERFAAAPQGSYREEQADDDKEQAIRELCALVGEEAKT